MNLLPIELLTAIPILAADVAVLDSKKPKIYPDGTGRWWVATVVMVLGCALFVITVLAVIRKPKTDEAKAKLKKRLAILLGLWTVLPPLWFAFEYIVLYVPPDLPGSWETFKFGQDMWAKLWAGIVALLGLRLFALKDEETKEGKERKDAEKKRMDAMEERLKKLEAR